MEVWPHRHEHLVGKMATIDQEVEDMEQEGEESSVQMYLQENGEEVKDYQKQDLGREGMEEGEEAPSSGKTIQYNSSRKLFH